ncbi:MAG TPA: SPW repeat protein [Vicinamibacterales bacterium]|nr:SPW repeat protein [Vicinamibacterales bacterium]
MRRVSWINLLVGIWLLIAPFMLNGFAHATVAANDVVLGFLLIATFSWMLAVTAASAFWAWFQVLCGLWLIVSPYALRYTDLHASTGNDLLMGLITIVVAFVTARALTRQATMA